MPHDLSHLGFLAGHIGRLITISTTPVIAGDSFEMDVFFFQAEDGIRGWSVTGVQTCALPIYEGNLEPYYVDLARHFGAAGPEEIERALRYGVLAADLATRRLAYEEAVPLLAAAVGELERHRPGDDERRAELLVRLAAARRRAGAWDDARATDARAAEAARRAGAAPLFAQAALGHSGGSWERFG